MAQVEREPREARAICQFARGLTILVAEEAILLIMRASRASAIRQVADKVTQLSETPCSSIDPH